MTNPFENRSLDLSGPALDIEKIIPNDSNDLAEVAVALYIETGGAITFVSASGATRTLNVADFAILPVGAKKVLATGTTATGIHAFLVS